MASSEFWFGPPERQLFARAYTPEGEARGAVVLCSALGYETPYTRTVYRRLARDLVKWGLAVVRVDCAGTGDSWEPEAVGGRVAKWLASIVQASDFVRQAGAPHVTLVGMRFGATLAAAASQMAGADAVVLWSPYPSGRAFLREQSFMFSVHMEKTLGQQGLGPDDVDGRRSMEILGTVFDRPTVDDMLGMGLGPIDQGTPVLLVGSAGRLSTYQVGGTSQKDTLTVEDLPNNELLDSAAQASGPVFQSITEWVSKHAPPASVPYALPTERYDRAESPDGKSSEQVVRLGPQELFGIITRPTGNSHGPVVVMVNAGLGDHLGPGRLHVELARDLASAGVRSVRLDIRGLGDSPSRPDGQAPNEYPIEAVADISEAIQSLPDCRDSRDVVLFGLCSGAFHAMATAAVTGAQGAIVINPGLLPSRNFVLRALNAAARRAPSRLRPHVEMLVPTLEARLLATRVARSGATILVVCSTREAKTWGRHWPALQKTTKKLCYREVAGSDHSLFAAGTRKTVFPMLREFVLAHDYSVPSTEVV